MRKFIYFFFFLLSVASLLPQCASDRRSLHGKLVEMAINLNESAPVMLNRYTRFDSACVTEDNVFEYHYTVMNISNPDSLIQIGMPALKKEISEKFALNQDLRIFKENNVIIEYVYNDEKGGIVKILKITPEDYK